MLAIKAFASSAFSMLCYIIDQRVVKFNNRYILCHKMFRLYLSTNLAEPNLSTEVASSVTLINYTTSREGLEEILIQRIFEHIQPSLNKEWRLTLTVGEQLIQYLYDLNEKLFARLVNKEGVHIWDEISYIADAVVCKRKVTQLLYKATQLSLRIQSIREELHTLASQSASILTIIDLLSHLHHEYRYSLPQLLEVFDIALPHHEIDEKAIVTINSSAEGSSTETEDDSKVYKNRFKLPNIPTLPTPGVKYDSLDNSVMREFKTYLSQSAFNIISRGLYENHRIMLAVMLCLQLESDYTEIIDAKHMQFLLYGPVLKDKSITDKQKPNWLPDTQWISLIAFSELSSQTHDLFVDFNEHNELWRQWYESNNPESASIGSNEMKHKESNRGSSEEDFMRILLLRCLREDRVVNGFVNYLREHIPIKPTLNDIPPLHEIIAELNPYQPILVLLPAIDDITHMYKSSVTMASDSVVKRIKMTAKVSIGMS